MPVNVYECMFLLDPSKVAGDIPAAQQHLHQLFEKNKIEILASRPWDERRLAYPIKNQKKGLYYLTYLKADSQALLNLERDYQLSEMILRSMTLKIDPKLVDTMLALARDEHALALQVASAEEPGEGEGGGEAGGDEGRPPRRGGRRPAEPVQKD